jgi:hypothetical protein
MRQTVQITAGITRTVFFDQPVFGGYQRSITKRVGLMNSIVYLVGAVVIVLFILGVIGLR